MTLNGEKRLPACLRALRASAEGHEAARSGATVEVLVVDNGSTDATAEVVRRIDPAARLISAGSNLGFAGGNDLGIEHAAGDVVVLLNDDAYPESGWLAALEEAAAELPDWGALGCLLLYPDGRRVQHAGGVVHRNGLTDHVGWQEREELWRDREPYRCTYVTGAALALRREAIELCGHLDAGYYPIYFEETDYCVRLADAGFGVYMVPSAVVLHDESQVTVARSRGYFRKYHRHRYRFLLKTRTARELVRTLRAELGWLRRRPHWRHWRYAWHAAWRTISGLPGILRARREHLRTVRRVRERLEAGAVDGFPLPLRSRPDPLAPPLRRP